MFDTQISSLEAQIQELSRKANQYRSLENEMESAMSAIARIKQSALDLDVQPEAIEQLAAVLGVVPKHSDQTPTPDKSEIETAEAVEEITSDEIEPVAQPAESEQVAPENEQTDIFTAIDNAETSVQVQTNCYDTAAKIEASLADEDEVDTHLMAIASILDSCPQNEIAGRVWFFVQNIPSDFDDRILGYLPKSIRPEWDKQRTFLEEEAKARESILPQQLEMPVNLVIRDLVETPSGVIGHIVDISFNAKLGGRIATVQIPTGREDFDINTLRYVGKYQEKSTPEFKVNDSVLTPTGETAVVVQSEYVGGRLYLEVQSPSGATETYFHTDIKPAPVEIVGDIAAPVAAATAKKARKPKAKQATSSEILQCKNWQEIRAIANNDPKLLKQAAT
nr:hypothetical protein [Brasilonema octagenarum HA4186-MV1]